MYTILGTDGKEYGPVTAGNVIEWIRDGRANLQTRAKLDRANEWKTLGDFAEFSGRDPVVAVAPPLLALNPESIQPAVDSAAAICWLRLPAALIDGLLKTLCYLPITIPLVRVVLAEALQGRQRSFTEVSQLTSELVNAQLPQALPLFGCLLLVQLCLLAWRGQSVGKLLLGLRIVRQDDGAAPGLYRAFLLRGTVPFIFEQIPVAGLVFWIVDSSLIFRDDHRCLHDLIAGTKVVRP
jgi:uncharacterized RDD family membrane protein YckC